MSLERRDQLVDHIMETQQELRAFVRNLPREHDLMLALGWDLLSYSYQKGFETLWDHARSDHSSLLLQPLLLLWRQSVELALKAAIFYIAGGITGNPGHNLTELFSKLVVARGELGFCDDDDLAGRVRAMISDVQSFDSSADRFRYPSARSGKSFGGIAADLDELFQAHWIIVTYCEGAAIEVEQSRGMG